MNSCLDACLLNSADRVYAWLAGLQVRTGGYDLGGIMDPIDGYVPGDHYGTTFFALLALVLWLRTGSEEYKQSFLSALSFHERTMKNEYEGGEWEYHWDFQNLALALIVMLLRSMDLPGYSAADLEKNVLRLLKRAPSNRNPTTNWIAMRALTHLVLGSPLQVLRSQAETAWVLTRQMEDGGFYDLSGSRPIAYHAYTAALLELYTRLSGRRAVEQRCSLAAAFLAEFIDPNGDFNYMGRGQKQIFGYGPAIFLLRSLGLDHLAEKVLSYLLMWQKVTGEFPLMLGPYSDALRIGWYDYHHLTVYNAFLATWLGLASMVEVLPSRPSTGSPEIERLRASFPRDHVYRSDRYFLVASIASNRYGCDLPGAIYHLALPGEGPIVTSPGGPVPGEWGNRWGKPEYALVGLGPVVCRGGAYHSLARAGEAWMHTSRNSVTIRVVSRAFTLLRTIEFEPTAFWLNDVLDTRGSADVTEVRPITIPVVEDNWKAVHCDGHVLLRGRSTEAALVLYGQGRLRWSRFGRLPTPAGSVEMLGCVLEDNKHLDGPIQVRLKVSFGR